MCKVQDWMQMGRETHPMTSVVMPKRCPKTSGRFSTVLELKLAPCNSTMPTSPDLKQNQIICWLGETYLACVSEFASHSIVQTSLYHFPVLSMKLTTFQNTLQPSQPLAHAFASTSDSNDFLPMIFSHFRAILFRGASSKCAAPCREHRKTRPGSWSNTCTKKAGHATGALVEPCGDPFWTNHINL